MGRLVVSMNLSLDGFIEAQGRDDGSWIRIDGLGHKPGQVVHAAASSQSSSGRRRRCRGRAGTGSVAHSASNRSP